MTASPIRSRRGFKARRDGRRGETLCALWLMAKGYRILGFRLKTAQAEIDLLARKGEVVAVVEVKRRTSLEAALDAVGPRQRERLLRAARSITARRPDLSGASIRLDLMALAPGRWPRHIPDAWRDC
ncbi:MAG TPA: YraN family protein [Caulobacteraceae bacterium]|jgi:putative endonuclease